MAKRSPEEVLDALDAWDEDDAIDAEMERVLAMTPEGRESELRAAGVDLKAERVKALEGRGKAIRAVPRRSVLRLLMPLAAVLAGLLGVLVVVGRMSPSRDVVDTAPRPPPRANELRKEAFAACDAQRWEECLQKLDEARKMDPDGEREARVQEYRHRAEGAAKGQ
jgi:hypothetical protein